jgi:hypothetical protein
MNDQLTLADKYLLLGLKLKDNGQVRCMFCHVYGNPQADGTVTVNHNQNCVIVDLYIMGGDHHGE